MIIFVQLNTLFMYDDFINEIDDLVVAFKESGDIEFLIRLEKLLYIFLDFTVLDYLEETNDYDLPKGAVFSSVLPRWFQSRT